MPSHHETGLLIVSHLTKFAEASKELLQQFIPEAAIFTAGGNTGLGVTGVELVSAINDSFASCQSVIIFADAGSSVLQSKAVLAGDIPGLSRDALTGVIGGKAFLATAPYLEGLFLAAAGIAQKKSFDQLFQELSELSGVDTTAGVSSNPELASTNETSDSSVDKQPQQPVAGVSAERLVSNELGLHARPAALLSRCVAEFESEVSINGASAASILELMRLGLKHGDGLVVTAVGKDEKAALAAVLALIETGFGEK